MFSPFRVIPPCYEYRLYCETSDMTFVGITRLSLMKCLYNHQTSAYKVFPLTQKNQQLYEWMREVGIKNVKIVKISNI